MKRKDRKFVCGIGEKIFPVLICLAIGVLHWSCKDDGENAAQYNPGVPIQVTQIAPSTGGIALPVVVSGQNFGTDKSKVKLFFDNKEAVIITAQNEHLYAVVPKLSGGEHEVRVVVDGQNEGVLQNQKFDYIVASSVTTVGGSGVRGTLDGPALEAKLYRPTFVDIDDKDNIIIIDNSDRVLLLSLEASVISTLLSGSYIYCGSFTEDFSYYYAGIYSTSQTRLGYEFFRDGNWAQGLVMNTDGIFDDKVSALQIDGNDNLYVAGESGRTIARVARKTGKIEVFGKLPYSQGTTYGMAYNPLDGYMYISSDAEHYIIRFDTKKSALTAADFEIYAGRPGVKGFYNGLREEATFSGPWGMDFDDEGNLYIADAGNHAIRKIDKEGMVTTFAGGNGAGYKDGVVETSQFYNPTDVTVSIDGLVYVADRNNYRIRCVAVQ